jgi:N-succinyldiaminopimelate aminotransferase
MNPLFDQLQPYPFEKLSALLNGLKPAENLKYISLAVGEPQHSTPSLIVEAINNNSEKFRNYPSTIGLPELRQTIAGWLEKRFKLANKTVNPATQVIPVAGTREALFSFARAVIDPTKNPLVLMPNPFYQIYEGACIFAGAETYFLNDSLESQHQMDLDSVPEQIWARCQMIYICSPGNPSGAVMPKEQQLKLLNLAEKYDFIIAADECYSEIYKDEANPPQGFLQTCFEAGNKDFKRCVVFHSLSKRSNAPGLRSGFVAGDAAVLKKYLQYRTYHGATMSLPSQYASLAAWSDEHHVIQNRALYREKFQKVEAILSGKAKFFSPPAGFYLWPQLDHDDQAFTKRLFVEKAVGVLPGSYLSRVSNNQNPGQGHIRLALVAEVDDCVEAANRIVEIL